MNMKKSLKILSLVLAAVLCLLLTGCQQEEAKPAATDAPAAGTDIQNPHSRPHAPQRLLDQNFRVKSWDKRPAGTVP